MKMSRWSMIAMLVAAGACNGGGSTGYGGNPPPPPPPSSGGHLTTITVSNNQFTPTPDTIPAGTITFDWNSGATVHNVTWLSGPGTLPTNSGDHSGTESYATTLAAGDYTYHCTHHAGMNGAIHVSP